MNTHLRVTPLPLAGQRAFAPVQLFVTATVVAVALAAVALGAVMSAKVLHQKVLAGHAVTTTPCSV